MKNKNRQTRRAFALSSIAAFALSSFVTVSAAEPPIPKPDDKPADTTKPVQVFILLGQSNMVGLGKVKGGEISLEHAVKEKKNISILWMMRVPGPSGRTSAMCNTCLAKARCEMNG